MNTNSTPLAGTVAIIDDRPRMRNRLAGFVRSHGLEPAVFPGRLSSVDSLVSEARQRGMNYAVCDHRLFELDYARFYGAEAVAGFYDSRSIAPVLLTGYEDEDAETSIRRYRRKIPSLLHAKDVSPNRLMSGLRDAQREAIEGIVRPERQSCPAVMTVTDMVSAEMRDGQEAVVRVIVAQWNPEEPVGFPLSMVPEQIRKAVVPGAFLYADVNVDAHRQEDLFFENFSLPDPDDVQAADTLFDNR